MSDKISARVCRKRLAILWITGGLFLFFVLILQSVFGRFGDRIEDAWSWFLPTLMPTLSLILGVLTLDATSGGDGGKLMDRFFFRLAFWLSALYLLVVGMTLFLQPFTQTPLLELMHRSNLWLGPLQGLAAAVLGIFFVKGERGPEK
jgi:hypothetical protein